MRELHTPFLLTRQSYKSYTVYMFAAIADSQSIRDWRECRKFL